MATVTFENVNKVFGDFHAVRDLNLEIGDGDSWSGRTIGLRQDDEPADDRRPRGDLLGHAADRRPGRQRRGPKDRDIAMVFQSYALYPHMSVRENLAFGLKLRKVPKPEIERG